MRHLQHVEKRENDDETDERQDPWTWARVSVDREREKQSALTLETWVAIEFVSDHLRD